MEKHKGYPLPPGDAFTEDMACAIVFYPDKPEYRRALGGSLAYLATWIAWQKESEHKALDAALSWQTAYELTMECWSMACFEQLQSDVAAILAIMQMPQSCCDEQDVTDGDRYTDRVQDGVGDVPQNVIDAGYADDAADWDGFDDYKCLVVHVTVNQLSARLNELAPLVEASGVVFGGLAALAAIITVIFSGGSAAFVFGLVAATGVVASLYDALFEGSLLEILATKVDDNHDELACAMYFEDGDESALVALNDKIDELFTVPEALILKNMNNGPTLKALYSGRYDQQDIAAELLAAGYELDDFDCSCPVDPVGEFQVTYLWPTAAWDGWLHDASGVVTDTLGNPPGSIYSRFDTGWLRINSNQLRTKVGLGQGELEDTVTIYQIEFDYMMTSSEVGKLRFEIDYFPGGIGILDYDNKLVWTHVVVIIPEEGWLVQGGYFAVKFTAIDGISNFYQIDNVFVDFDASPD